MTTPSTVAAVSRSTPGRVHYLEMTATGVRRSCPGFKYRNTCAHVKQLQEDRLSDTQALARSPNGAAVPAPQHPAVREPESFSEIERLGAVLVKSGYFKDASDQAKAIVKVLAGRELGIGPIAAMQGIYIVEGKVTLSAQLVASCIQRSGRFRYRVRTWTDQACEIEFYEGNELLGPASFTRADAERAKLWGKNVWISYPKAMLWARAITMGARAFTPSVFNGPVYTPEELGAEVDEDGNPTRAQQAIAAPAAPTTPDPHDYDAAVDGEPDDRPEGILAYLRAARNDPKWRQAVAIYERAAGYGAGVPMEDWTDPQIDAYIASARQLITKRGTP